MSALRTGIFGIILPLLGIALSGPIGVAIITLVKAQPAWTVAAQFAHQYHLIQPLPYFFGFLLISGFVIMMAARYQIADDTHKVWTLVAVIFTGVYSALICLNYIIQTTSVPGT